MSAETVLKDFAKEIAFPPDVPNGIMYNAGCNAMAAAAVQALADKGLSVLPTATIDTLVAALDTMIAWANGAPGGYPGSEVEAALALARKVSP